MRHPRRLPLVAIVVFVGCKAASPPPDARTRAVAAIDIQEAVFVDLFENNESTLQLRAEGYYISVDRRDAGSALLARFKEHEPAVLPDSRCDSTSFSAVVDRETGRRGIRFAIFETMWTSADRVRVDAAWMESDRAIGRYVYFVERGDEGWRVESREEVRVR